MNIGNSNRIADKQNHLASTELNQLMLHLPCKSVDGKTPPLLSRPTSQLGRVLPFHLPIIVSK
jgi:hypothetical protein